MSQDKVLIDRARKASEDLALALNEASDAGMLLECVAAPRGAESQGQHVVKQWAWYVQVFARRVTHM